MLGRGPGLAIVCLVFFALGMTVLTGCNTPPPTKSAEELRREAEEARRRAQEAARLAEQLRKEREKEACDKIVLEGKSSGETVPADGRSIVTVDLTKSFSVANLPPGKRLKISITELPSAPVVATESESSVALRVGAMTKGEASSAREGRVEAGQIRAKAAVLNCEDRAAEATIRVQISSASGKENAAGGGGAPASTSLAEAHLQPDT